MTRKYVRSDDLIAEIKNIKAARKGLVSPRDLVEWAEENPNSELHKQFEWSNDDAAEAYRLLQARQLLSKFKVHYVLNHKDVKTRYYLSLKRDRNVDGGYRTVKSILRREDLKAEMLQEALAELLVFKKKYAILKALSGIFNEIDKLQNIKQA
jgi:hypothetical protein